MNTIKKLLQTISTIDQVKYSNFNELLETQNEIFNKFFVAYKPIDECIYLKFHNQIDCDLFYTQAKYGFEKLDYCLMYVLDDNQPFTLSLKPVIDIPYISDILADFSYNYNLDFKVEFQQSFTNHYISWYFIKGDIINPEARIEINTTFPYISLGRLHQIFYDEEHFKLFNPVINYHQSTLII